MQKNKSIVGGGRNAFVARPHKYATDFIDYKL